MRQLPPPPSGQPENSPRPTSALPPTSSAPTGTPARSQRGPTAPGVARNLDGHTIYLFKIALGESNCSGLLLLLHTRTIPTEELQAMVADVEQIVLQSRVVPRRKELAASRAEVPDVQKFSEDFFPADAQLFETIMVDKYEFLTVPATNVDARIEPTAKASKTAA